MPVLRSLALGATLLALSPVSPASLHAQSRDTTVRLDGTSVVDITVRTGRVIVRGIEGSSGAVRAGGGDYQLRTTGVTMSLVAPERNTRGPIELDVPRGVRLVISTLSADVEVRGVRGGVEARSTSGSFVLDDVSGRVIVETISGDVSARGNLSLLRAVTVSGDVRADDVRGEVDMRSTSGDLHVRGEGITRLGAETMSGDVQVDGQLTDDARVRIGTHSGDVTVRLPGDARGRIELSTVTGELNAGGPLTLQPGSSTGARGGRNTRRFDIGGGGPLTLDITTFSGDVRLLRGPRA